MIDILMLYMALTLSVAGFFLFRDHVRFLRCTHSVRGKVSSIQHVFISQLTRADDQELYPVIEYAAKGGAIKFTAIDPDVDGSFHVGDNVNLRFTKTRRKQSRACKTAVALTMMLLALAAILLSDMAFNTIEFTMENIFLASGVIAICLAALVSYVRDCDETLAHGFTRTAGGEAQLCLFEPAAYKNWASSYKDHKQINKIRSKQFFGATCFCSAMLMVAMTVQ